MSAPSKRARALKLVAKLKGLVLGADALKGRDIKRIGGFTAIRRPGGFILLDCRFGHGPMGIDGCIAGVFNIYWDEALDAAVKFRKISREDAKFLTAWVRDEDARRERADQIDRLHGDAQRLGYELREVRR